MDITAQKIQEIITLLQKRFPDWQSFSAPPDPKFHQEEINYKQKLSAEAKRLLAPNVFEEVFNLSEGGEAFEALIDHIESVGQSANLLYLSTPAKGDLNILYDPRLDKPAFCRAFFDLLHGDGASDERLGRYLTYVEAHHLPSKWTFPTYYLFVYNPDEDIFIKPESTRNFFNFIGAKDLYKSKPTAERYKAFKAVFQDLKSALSEYVPRDMIDIHSLVWVVAKNIPSYWKITPEDYFLQDDKDAIQDEDWVYQWEEWRKQGCIAIGSVMGLDLGDISGLTRSEFYSRRDEILLANPGWEKRGINQVWSFSQLQVGDRIIANEGTSKVLGIGTVTGPYYYDPDAEIDPHRLPVQWDDTVPRNVHKCYFNWGSRFLELKAEEFEAICSSPPASDSQDIVDRGVLVRGKKSIPLGRDSASTLTKASINPDCPFNLTTFELLAKLHHNPKKTVYDAHKQDFKSRLEEPFQRLMLDVAAQLPAPIRELMEIRHRIFGRILKNDFGQGGAYEHYWGAFYPKGIKRTEGAQLILIAGYDRLTFGFDIGHYSSQQRERFLTNCQKYYGSLVELLESSLNQPHLRFGDRGKISFASEGIAYDPDQLSFEKWLKNLDSSGVHVFTTLSKANVLSYSRDALRDEICKVFSQLFPLVLLATLDEPMSSLQEYLDSIEPDDETLISINESYSLHQCAQETYLAESLLDTWVRAIHRKGQAVLYGPPGTGKTYLARRLAQHLISEKDGFVELVQFHPAYTYEDFMQGIRPQRTEHGLDYPTVPGRFLDFCRRARGCQDTCVLIIDEINRANLAQVFGELMYLLEYREDKVALAGGKPFSIPKNVRIIGTMNTADRSIALVDHALRRRFAFLPLYPNMSILRKYHASTGFAVDGLVQVLTQVNQAISDRQYQLGTSFFLRDALNTELPAIWQMEIEPYLEEYFFDRPEQVDKFRWAIIQNQFQL